MKESARIKPIRSFTREDIPQVSDMLERLLLPEAPSGRMLSVSELPDYLEQVFFDNPWYDESMPSLVYQGTDGKLIGFLALVARRMLFQERPIRVAISLHFMVEPESRSTLAGVQLLRALFAGAQDLVFTDGAGTPGRRVWEGVGGVTSLLYSQRWMRILRPARQAVSTLKKHGATGGNKLFSYTAQALSPLVSLADITAARMLPRYFSQVTSPYSEEDLEIDTVLAYLPQFSKGAALRPVYDERSLRWLFDQAAQMKLHGEFRKVQLRDQEGEVAGWYLYYLKAGGLSSVIQIAARKHSEGEVIDHLFDHARRNGAAAISGRLEPRLMQEMADRGCFFNRVGCLTLMHSKNAEILNAIHRGDAFLTQLEGEWCVTP
jgi:hypothetical protein